MTTQKILYRSLLIVLGLLLLILSGYVLQQPKFNEILFVKDVIDDGQEKDGTVNEEKERIVNNIDPDVVKCQKVDELFNSIGEEIQYSMYSLLPMETRVFPNSMIARRQDNDKVFYHLLVFKNLGSPHYISEGKYQGGNNSFFPIIISPVGNNINGGFYYKDYIHPSSFSAFSNVDKNPGYKEDGYVQDVQGVPLNGSFFLLSSGSCGLSGGVCDQKFFKLDSTGNLLSGINIPSEYAPVLESWVAPEEAGVSNINTYLKTIAGIKGDSIIFRTDEDHLKDSKLISYDTVNNNWLEIDGKTSFLKTNIGEDIMSYPECMTYFTPLGDFVFLKDKLGEPGSFQLLNVYFIKTESANSADSR